MIDHLKTLNACEPAIEWLEGKTQAEAWATCPQADWMIWLSMRMAGRPGWSSWQDVVLVLCDCVEPSLVPGDNRPQEALAAARGLVAGTVSVSDADAARAAARAAASAAYAAAYAAAAARAAAAAARAAASAYAAARAADAADAAFSNAASSNAADAAANAANAAVAGGGLSLAEMADLIRSRLTIGDLS